MEKGHFLEAQSGFPYAISLTYFLLQNPGVRYTKKK
jgi:hypothetical protein